MPKIFRERFHAVIGLEVHAQLLTHAKAYSNDANEYGDLPNTNVSVITLAHPGTLPRSNKEVVNLAIKMGLACGSQITRFNHYDRKNYFYPDLPKGYQLTQDKTPICVGGSVPIKPKNGEPRIIKLTRIHMEEDAGKSLHLDNESDSLVDLNRAGVPLIEIVSDPDMHDPEEAYAYLTEIRRLVRYLDVCDGNMEEGSLRCDANISVMPVGSTTFGKRVEVKNMNSIRNVARAIEHEINRQVDIIEAGNEVVSETRMFDATTGNTYSLRTKESLNDYRYFPEPDLQPIVVSDAWIEGIKASMPPLPNELFRKFTEEYGLPEYDANVLTDTRDIALYFYELCKHTTNYKAASNWVMGPVKSRLNELTLAIENLNLTPARLAELIALIDSGKISYTVATQSVFPELFTSNESPEAIAMRLDLIQDSSADNIQPFIEQALSKYPDKIIEYKNGKKGLIGLFMGEVMKLSGGKADPKVASKLVAEALEK